MRIIITIITAFLLASTIAFAEGDPGCEWEVTEETNEYIMESCGPGSARIRSKNSIETTSVPQKEKPANPIDKFKKDIIETPDSVETEKEIKKIEEDVKITEEKVKKVIEEIQLEKK